MLGLSLSTRGRIAVWKPALIYGDVLGNLVSISVYRQIHAEYTSNYCQSRSETSYETHTLTGQVLLSGQSRSVVDVGYVDTDLEDHQMTQVEGGGEPFEALHLRSRQRLDWHTFRNNDPEAYT